ncbi:MAG: metallophosphoesterase [Limnothrix sp. RL_2_0]|nr:metallophosphoesterase [Limnothrix sp. RL_2_0]
MVIKFFSRQKLKYAAFGLTGAIATLVIWSFIEPYTLNIENETATMPHLDPSWDNTTIAQIADLQIGLKRGNPSTVRRSINKIVARKPFATVISGDFLYHATPAPQPQIDKVIELLTPLTEANIPTYVVLGNHDYGMSGKSETPDLQLADRLTTALEDLGIEVLSNEFVKISHPDNGSPLYIVGIDSKWANQEDAEKAFEGIPENSPHIVIMHNPESFKNLPENSAALALAGHTHGGQVRIPGFPRWSWLQLVKDKEVYADGWVENYGKEGNRLYVNPGIGMSIVPIRLFCPPELAFFNLQSQP